jgi:2-amino-4-hydroxy-6-hydroxymethyldihydropteridine diphosphokinase
MNRVAFIGVGSNIDAYRNCLEGITRVTEDERVELLGLSSLYRTSPVSPILQDDFLNSVFKIGWKGEPVELLSLLETVEQRMGRKRDVLLGPRTLDLDILLFGDLVLETSRLTIPHPRLHERKFVLIPCLEIDSDLVHPEMKLPLARLLGLLGDEQKITPFRTITREEIEQKRKGADERRRLMNTTKKSSA